MCSDSMWLIEGLWLPSQDSEPTEFSYLVKAQNLGSALDKAEIKIYGKDPLEISAKRIGWWPTEVLT